MRNAVLGWAATLMVGTVGLPLGMLWAQAPVADAPARANTVLIEAEQLQFPGPWKLTISPNCSGNAYMLAGGSEREALTAVEIPADGLYNLWTRSRCYQADQPGTRRYRLVVNDEPAARESGVSTNEGWVWECVGQARLTRGPNALALRDTARFFGRCDAILLTTTPLDPTPLKPEQWAPWRLAPTPLPSQIVQPLDAPPQDPVAPASDVAVAAADQVRLRFAAIPDGPGGARIGRSRSISRNPSSAATTPK